MQDSKLSQSIAWPWTPRRRKIDNPVVFLVFCTAFVLLPRLACFFSSSSSFHLRLDRDRPQTRWFSSYLAMNLEYCRASAKLLSREEEPHTGSGIFNLVLAFHLSAYSRFVLLLLWLPKDLSLFYFLALQYLPSIQSLMFSSASLMPWNLECVVRLHNLPAQTSSPCGGPFLNRTFLWHFWKLRILLTVSFSYYVLTWYTDATVVPHASCCCTFSVRMPLTSLEVYYTSGSRR